MRLPPDQEQNVIKCRQCPKFFLTKSYLQKHYQRHHPQADFFKEFQEDHPHQQIIQATQQATTELQTTVNQRLEQMAKHIQEDKSAKARQQEELFNKIKEEMFKQFADSMRQVEQDLSTIKSSKQSNEELVRLINQKFNTNQAKDAEHLQERMEELFSLNKQELLDVKQRIST